MLVIVFRHFLLFVGIERGAEAFPCPILKENHLHQQTTVWQLSVIVTISVVNDIISTAEAFKLRCFYLKNDQNGDVIVTSL